MGLIITLAIIITILLIFIALSEYLIHFMLSRRSSLFIKREKPDPIFFTRASLEERKAIYRWLASSASIYITARDGLRLHAFLKRAAEPSHKWLITVHGYRGSTTNNGSLAIYLNKHGWNVIVVEQRAHGESQGKWITMGKEESQDILMYITYVRKLDRNAKILLHGESMGAATMMLAAGFNPEGVIAVVEDCGYSTLMKEYMYQVKSNTFMKGKLFIKFLSLWSRLKLGLRFEDVNPIKSISETKLPVLFIHGDSDRLVPTEMVYELYNACKSPKELWITKDTGHAVSIEYHKEEYCKRILSFANKYI